jgi:hypothetical protein
MVNKARYAGIIEQNAVGILPREPEHCRSGRADINWQTAAWTKIEPAPRRWNSKSAAFILNRLTAQDSIDDLNRFFDQLSCPGVIDGVLAQCFKTRPIPRITLS